MTNINQAAFFQKHLNVCFSGHRPNKLPDAGDLSQPAMNAVYHDLLIMIDNAVTEGKSNFIHGMMSVSYTHLDVYKRQLHRLYRLQTFRRHFDLPADFSGAEQDGFKV